jgi:hypothetical protein
MTIIDSQIRISFVMVRFYVRRKMLYEFKFWRVQNERLQIKIRSLTLQYLYVRRSEGIHSKTAEWIFTK